MMGVAGIFSSNHFLMSAVWWSGFVVVGICFGLTQPASSAILSARVGEENQAKVQAVMGVVVNIGTAVGGFIWGSVIFNAKDRGLKAGLPFLVTAAVVALALVIYMGLTQVYGTDGGRSSNSDSEGDGGGASAKCSVFRDEDMGEGRSAPKNGMKAPLLDAD
jgi:MFS family permease